MSVKHELTRNLLEQEPGRVNSHAMAADSQIITQRKSARYNGGTPYTVTSTDGGTFPIVVSGRVRWALNQLRAAGTAGCTPIDNLAPRWASYILDLRGMGVEIDTLHEPHEGELAGMLGRHVLRSTETCSAEGGAV